jgi:hypothetical protein
MGDGTIATAIIGPSSASRMIRLHIRPECVSSAKISVIISSQLSAFNYQFFETRRRLQDDTRDDTRKASAAVAEALKERV